MKPKTFKKRLPTYSTLYSAPCVHCGGLNVFASKYIFKNNTFHYKLSCPDCFSHRFMERSKELYCVLKNIPWNISPKHPEYVQQLTNKRDRFN